MKKYSLEKLTIIIFSYNRHQFLKRTIKYWSSFDVKLLILDGSDTNLDYPNLNSYKIKYVHDKRGLYKRLLSSKNYIDTEYIMLASDDEFYLPSALSSCINFLSNHPSYSSCGGCAIGFSTSKKKIYGFNQYPKLVNYHLDSENPLERVQKHFSNYFPAHIYSVIRSNKWHFICKTVFEKEYNCHAIFELQLEFLTIISGKSKIIPELLWLRNKEVTSIKDTDVSLDETNLMEKWLYESKYHKEKLFFLNKMEESCKKIISDKNASLKADTIFKIFEIYINSDVAIIKKNFIRKLINFLPRKVKKLLKSIIQLFRKILTKKISLYNKAKDMQSNNISVNFVELENIISILKNS